MEQQESLSQAPGTEGSAPPEQPSAPSVDMNDVMRQMAGLAPSASNLESDGAEAVASHASAESASDTAESDDVSAGGAGSPSKPGRRASKAEANAQRIAELERQLAERDPEQIRQQVLAEQRGEVTQSQAEAQRRADAARFRELQDTPDADLTGEEYAWREEQKKLISIVPGANQLLENLLAHDRQLLWADVTGKQNAFWKDVGQQFSRLAERPGVDANTVNTVKSIEQVGAHLYDAGAASRQPEIDELRAEVEDLRQFGPRGISAARTPFAGGSSGASSGASFDMNAFMRRAAGLS